MPAVAARPTGLIPSPRSSVENSPGLLLNPSGSRAVSYQRVLHQLVRRELRLVAELVSWAPADDAERTAALTGHAELIGRLLLHHHDVERDRVWPALLPAVPDGREGDVRSAVEDWTGRCARIDHLVRDLATLARQWGVVATGASRDTFAAACRTLADAVDAQTAEEERTLLPLLGEYLPPDTWAEIARFSHCRLSAREQLLVLGLALEDSCAADRARLLHGLTPAARLAWRMRGRHAYRVAVVRLRGAPPAA